jgi:hypothetical protein
MIKTKPIQEPNKAKLTNGEGVADTTCRCQLQHLARSAAFSTAKVLLLRKQNAPQSLEQPGWWNANAD